MAHVRRRCHRFMETSRKHHSHPSRAQGQGDIVFATAQPANTGIDLVEYIYLPAANMFFSPSLI